ncbi:MAG: hypothetical protein ACRET2_04365, partial [Steroidobacteraceae bacterium]
LSTGTGHTPMLPRDQVPIQITLEQRLPPPLELMHRERLLSKPSLLRPMSLQVILVDELTDLLTAISRRADHYNSNLSKRANDSLTA